MESKVFRLRYLFLATFLFVEAAHAECPDYLPPGQVFTLHDLDRYASNPDVVRFPLSSEFICYNLKLLQGHLSSNGVCSDPPSQISMPADALGPGVAYVTKQITRHKSKCESIVQAGLSYSRYNN